MALSLSYQPISNKIYYSKSPLIYKFDGCVSSNTYIISLSATTGADSTLAEYVTISRTCDINNRIIFDASYIIKNFIKSNFSTVDNVIYVKVSCLEYTGQVINNYVASDICVAVFGYSEYMDGFNYYNNSSAYIMSSVPKIIFLPSYGGIKNTYSIPFCNNDNCTYHINYYSLTSGQTYTATTSFPVITDAKSNIINIKCGYSDINSDVDPTKEMELVINASNMSIIHSIKIKPELCNGNELNYLKFINKYGCWDKIFIRGKVQEVSKYTSDLYKFNDINYDNMTYDKTGTYHKLNTNGRTSYILNTSWVMEGHNKQFDELKNSEYVYYNDIPVVVTDTEHQFKTHKNDKLINYTINIDVAYDKINKIL